TPAPVRRRGRGGLITNLGWWLSANARLQKEAAAAARGATEHGEDAADRATARSEAVRSAEAPKSTRAGKQALKRSKIGGGEGESDRRRHVWSRPRRGRAWALESAVKFGEQVCRCQGLVSLG